jgi:peroxiredoxin
MCEAKADCGNKSCCEDSAAKCSEKQLKDATEADMAVAPDFTLMDHNGNEVALSDYEDKIVVLEWFNYECPFVVPEYEAGTQKALAEKYAEDGVVWLAINSTSHAKQEMNKEWVNKYDLPFAILDDSSGEVGRKYGATNTPHIFIINKDGHIVYEGAINNATRAVKPDEGFEAYADNALEAVVNGKEVPTDKTKPIGCTVKYAK